MTNEPSGYTHDASDKKLDHAADEAKADDASADSKKHAEHDDADKASDRNRLEKDVARHHHPADEVGTISDKDTHAKREHP